MTTLPPRDRGNLTLMLSAARRGYGYKHKRLRLRWKAIVDSGQACCAGCGGWIAPGSAWHLDHDDTRQAYLGVSHAKCNVIAGAKRGYQAQQRSFAIRRAMWERW